MVEDSVGQSHRDVIKATSIEHASIAEAQQRLENALTRAAQSRNKRWPAQVSAELQRLLESLRAHVDSAEGPEGLMSEIEKAVLAINDRIVAVLKDHRRILEECAELVSMALACNVEEKESLRDLRQRVAGLINEIRQHRGREISLIDQVFNSKDDRAFF